MTDKLFKLLPELGVIRAIVSEERLKELAALDASDQIVNSKSDLAAMVRTLTMQKDQALGDLGNLEIERMELRLALTAIAGIDPLTQGDIAVRIAERALKGE